MMDWQPIESAPKNLASVLLASNAGHVCLGNWSATLNGWQTNIGPFHAETKAAGKPCYVTHWMPLPEPPTE
jgi:hypothetical protein